MKICKWKPQVANESIYSSGLEDSRAGLEGYLERIGKEDSVLRAQEVGALHDQRQYLFAIYHYLLDLCSFSLNMPEPAGLFSTFSGKGGDSARQNGSPERQKDRQEPIII